MISESGRKQNVGFYFILQILKNIYDAIMWYHGLWGFRDRSVGEEIRCSNHWNAVTWGEFCWWYIVNAGGGGGGGTRTTSSRGCRSIFRWILFIGASNTSHVHQWWGSCTSGILWVSFSTKNTNCELQGRRCE